jgi:hypothetical protein
MRRTHLEHDGSAYPPLADMTADMLGVRLRVKLRRTHLEYNESAHPPLTDMTADMFGVHGRTSCVLFHVRLATRFWANARSLAA